jgi:ATP-dependent helicase/nuclease subunit B
MGPLKIDTPHGRQLHVKGRIDRIDLLPGATHAAVYDYKHRSGRLSPADIYNGLSLQLLSYLLVLQANGHELAGAPITPAAGFYLQLMRGYDSVPHPDEATDPATDEFHYSPKARGVIDATHLDAFDNALAGGASPVVQVLIKKDGSYGSAESSDICDADEFLGLLDYVRGKLASLTDAIIGGDIRPRPYRLGKTSPCGQCGYRSLCRFDTTLNGYNIIGGISRVELLTKYRKGSEEKEKPSQV